MTKGKIGLAVATAALIGTFFTGPASAETVAEILKKVDANLTKVKDQLYHGEIQVIKDGKTTKTMKFDVKLKGLTMKLVKFTAPGDVRGMSILTTPDGLMYVYLPSYKRVRRVASHVRNQGFMGTDLSPEDLSSASLSEGWDASLETEDAQSWVLSLKPKPGNESTYSRLRATVLKKYGGVSKLEYFDSGGKVAKMQVRSDWKSFGPITLPTLFTVTDLKTGSMTLMRFFGCEVNIGMPDSDFSKRAIMRAD